MPDKLTGSEIVKALRSWLEEIRKARQEYLEKVNEEHYPSMRYEYLLSDTINEINRLQAEIERLKDYTITVEKEVDWYRDELRHSDKKVATKAYKEVFQKLNDKALVRKIKLFGGWFIVKGVTLHDINTLKKELVGEDK